MARPGISPAISMIPADPERCSASPEIAWMDTGVSNTFWALSLFAVTTISSSAALSAAGAAPSAAAARPGNAPRLIRQSVTASESLLAAHTRPDIADFLSVIVVDAGIVARADHADDVDAVRGCCLETVQLLARQKNNVPCRNTRLLVLGPHVALAGQHDDRLFVQMAMRRGLGPGDVANELRDDVGSNPLVHEHLEVSRAHRGPLIRIHT